MAPHIVVHLFKPLQTALVAGEVIALDERNQRLDMHPPKFLVPLQLLGREALAVHEVEDALVLFVPAIFQHGQGNLLRLFNQVGAIQALA